MEMTEEAKLEAEQAEVKAKASASAKDDETTEEEEKSKSDEESKQLEAELQRERKAREDAEKAAADMAFKLREKKRNDEEEVEEEEKPLTASQLQIVLAKEREATRKEMQAAEIDRIASGHSTSETEKQLILEIHKNRSFPNHLSLGEQIEECYLLANKKKILGENSELKRALRGKGGISNDFSSTHHDALSGTAPKIAASDNAELARVGFKYNLTTKRYEKKLSNGSMLVKKDLESPAQNVKA